MTSHLISTELDLRAQKSKQALFDSFMMLVQNNAYSTITIQKIINHAGVARSTFYEHFKNKDDILISSLSGPFSVFTQNALGNGSLEENLPLLEHFWERRSLARIFFTHPFHTKLIKGLTECILISLKKHNLKVSHGGLALQLATTQIMPLGSWLTGEFSTSKEKMAALLISAGTILPSHIQ